MNIVDVVILARKSNIRSPDGYKLTVSHMSIEDLQRFAKLVAQAAYKSGYCDGTVIEREACAKVCSEAAIKLFGGKSRVNQIDMHTAGVLQDKAETIRARNTT